MLKQYNKFKCHKISSGYAKGELLISHDPICFYLIDPKTGVVIEKDHELFGVSISKKILIFPNGKGSSVVQADGMYQLKMHDMAPKAMIIKNPDTTLVASSIILDMPLVDRLDDEFYKKVQDNEKISLDADKGFIELLGGK